MEDILYQLEKADRLAAITQRVGFTLWQLQELEGVTAQYFVLLAKAQKGVGLDAGNVLIEKAMKKTFGATIYQISEVGLLSTDLENRFENLLVERNWLVHRSRDDSRSAIHSDIAVQKVMERLDAIADESLSLLKEIAALSEAYVKEHGVTEKYINEKDRELLEQWHTSDAI